MAPERHPTETSPLLGAESSALPPSTGAISSDSLQGLENAQSEQHDVADEALRPKDVSLRYVVPAVSIGVCARFSFLKAIVLTRSGIPLCSGPDHYHGQRWSDWK